MPRVIGIDMPDNMQREDGTARFAYVTFVMMNDSYVPGALLMAYGLRRQWTEADLVCLVTPEITAEAREAPSIGDVAARVGVTARTLSGGFRKFRGLSPRGFLAARRLEGFRQDLETLPEEMTVTAIASAWGFSNFGALAGRYRARFGETPSQTRRRKSG